MRKKIRIDNDSSVLFYLDINELTFEVIIETLYKDPESLLLTTYSINNLGIFSEKQIDELDQEKIGIHIYNEYNKYLEKRDILKNLFKRLKYVKSIEFKD